MSKPLRKLILPLALILGLLAGSARAEDPRLEQAKRLFEQGTTSYRLGNFAEALAQFKDALKLVNRPSIILNVAQCYRQLDRPREALFFYLLYQTEWQRANPDKRSPYHDEITQHVAKLSKQVKQMKLSERPRARFKGDNSSLRVYGTPRGAPVTVATRAEYIKARAEGRLPTGHKGKLPLLLPKIEHGSYWVGVRKPGHSKFDRWIWLHKGEAMHVEANIRPYRRQIRHARDSSLMVLVPAGSFKRGSLPTEGHPDERPQRDIWLDDFYIDKYEVSMIQYRWCVHAKACSPPATGASCTWRRVWQDKLPVNCVNWHQANAYCHFAGKRLPTEAEWEKAARGTDGRRYPWGNIKPSCAEAQFDKCGNRIFPVDSFGGSASPYGAVQMAGNLWEWVADWYAEDYYKKSPARDPQGPDSGKARVTRGGGYQNDELSVTFRNASNDPSVRYVDNGFRCAMDPPK
jgi:formylglycine-generating enzyme required for sulfatase activity